MNIKFLSIRLVISLTVYVEKSIFCNQISCILMNLIDHPNWGKARELLSASFELWNGDLRNIQVIFSDIWRVIYININDIPGMEVGNNTVLLAQMSCLTQELSFTSIMPSPKLSFKTFIPNFDISTSLKSPLFSEAHFTCWCQSN